MAIALEKFEERKHMRSQVFLSWSGSQSQQMATALHYWLPNIIQAITPWMSSTDILAGARWQNEIAKKLDECIYGIICVTPQSLGSAWMLFEAGALSKKLHTSRVCPLLIGVDKSQLIGPLSQFQAVDADEQGLLALVHSLNDSIEGERLPDKILEQSFKKFFSDLDSDLGEVRTSVALQSEMRFRVIQSRIDRTKAIVDDLRLLDSTIRSGADRVCIRYSGFLSPFAISDKEIADEISRPGVSDQEITYLETLKHERDLMIKLADDSRFDVKCIITPPSKTNVPKHILHHTQIRLQTLKEFLKGEGGRLNIDWAISPYQQKNTYIIGSTSCFEGFKQGAEDGYRFTLRYAGSEEVGINITMFDLLFDKVVRSTLTCYRAEGRLEDRESLRRATVQCIEEALSNILSHGRDRRRSNSPQARRKR